jgi:dTMP kinase
MAKSSKTSHSSSPTASGALARGLFFAFDGIDGAGKSTQTRLFADWLAERGYRVVTCRDPGSTELGERLRDLILARHGLRISPWGETLMYMAARAQLVAEIIAPALADQAIVVCDRFLLANVAYQGYGLELGADTIRELGRFATQNIEPAHTFVLDIDVQVAARRLAGNADRMEQRGREYFERVRHGFRTEAARDPAHMSLVNADRPIDEVQADIRSIALKTRNGESPIFFDVNGARQEKLQP